MDLTNKEEDILIELLDREIRRNPFDKEKLELIRKIKRKKMDKEVINSRKRKFSKEEGEAAAKAVKAFYKVGLIPTPNTEYTTDNDVKAATDYIILSLKIEELRKKLYKLIKENKFDKYEEFEEYIIRHERNVVNILKERNKIVENQQREFRRRIEV